MAKVNNIDKRTKVGTQAWYKNHDEETARLSIWRRLHMLLPHELLTQLAKPDDPIEDLIALAKRLEK